MNYCKLYLVKFTSLLILFSAISGLFLSSVWAQNIDPKAEAILKKHADAIGIQQLEKISTLVSIGLISQMGSDMQVSILQKRPNLYRMDIHLEEGRISQAFDGEKGWMLNPFVFQDTVEISGSELAQLMESALFDGVLLNSSGLKYKLSYGGEDHIATAPSFVLILKKPGGNRMKFFIDKKTYLIRRTEASFSINGFPVEANSVFSDYRTIKGITLPYMIENTNGQLKTTIRIETVRFGEDIEDLLFKAPVSF